MEWQFTKSTSIDEAKKLFYRITCKNEELITVVDNCCTIRKKLSEYLRPHFSHTRLGLSMTLALMTILFYQYNCKLFDKLAGPQTDTIYSSEGTIKTYSFGIVDKQVEQNVWGSKKCHSSQLFYYFHDVTQTIGLSDSVSGVHCMK